MKKYKKGFILLDCIMGAALLTVASIFVLESTTGIFKWSKMLSIESEAKKLLIQQRKHYESGNNIAPSQSGNFANGSPFELEAIMDNHTMPPLEKVHIQIIWNPNNNKEKKMLQTVAVRLRQ